MNLLRGAWQERLEGVRARSGTGGACEGNAPFSCDCKLHPVRVRIRTCIISRVEPRRHEGRKE